MILLLCFRCRTRIGQAKDGYEAHELLAIHARECRG